LMGFSQIEVPRRKHTVGSDVMSCCREDGNIGTWVMYGQSIFPQLITRSVGRVREQAIDATPRTSWRDDPLDLEGDTQRREAEAGSNAAPRKAFDPPYMPSLPTAVPKPEPKPKKPRASWRASKEMTEPTKADPLDTLDQEIGAIPE
jgi:hypothetical protein